MGKVNQGNGLKCVLPGFLSTRIQILQNKTYIGFISITIATIHTFITFLCAQKENHVYKNRLVDPHVYGESHSFHATQHFLPLPPTPEGEVADHMVVDLIQYRLGVTEPFVIWHAVKKVSNEINETQTNGFIPTVLDSCSRTIITATPPSCHYQYVCDSSLLAQPACLRLPPPATTSESATPPSYHNRPTYKHPD